MKEKRNRIPYVAAIRDAHFNIRRGDPAGKKGKPSGEHRSEVYTKNGKKE